MPAPEGNKFWMVRQQHGRLKAWDSVEEMQQTITAYFEECENYTVEVPVKEGKVTISKPQVPTVEGLCRVLGLNRDSLINYSKEPGYEAFFDTVKDAKAWVQEQKTSALINDRGNATGLIFDLKNNHGYVDKTVQDNNVDLRGKPAWLTTFTQTKDGEGKS